MQNLKYKIKNVKLKIYSLLLIAYSLQLVFLFNPVSAVAGYGTSGAQILNLNSPARIAAMGNANAGLADDVNAVVYNPAGLMRICSTEFQVTQLFYYLDSSLSSLTYGQRIGRAGLGLKIKLFSSDDTYRDSMGYNEKKFNIKYSQYSLGFGVPVYGMHSVGATANVVYENFALGAISEYGKDKKGCAVGFDVGWLYRMSGGDSFGIVVKNIGRRMKVGDEGDRLPLKCLIGGGHSVGRFLFAWEACGGRQVDFSWKCGAEADILGFKMRGGFLYITSLDITAGFGIPYRNWTFDYAFFPHRDLGAAHRLSLGASF